MSTDTSFLGWLEATLRGMHRLKLQLDAETGPTGWQPVATVGWSQRSRSWRQRPEGAGLFPSMMMASLVVREMMEWQK